MVFSTISSFQSDCSLRTTRSTYLSDASERLVGLFNCGDFEMPIELEHDYAVSSDSLTSLRIPSLDLATGSDRIDQFEMARSSERSQRTIRDKVPIKQIPKPQLATQGEMPPKQSIKGDDFRPHSECIASWIPVLESTKSNIVKLIDKHINSLKEEARNVHSQQEDWLDQFRMTQNEKSTERKACIRRIREELTIKMETINDLLDKMERI